jgi:hypothetical protein
LFVPINLIFWQSFSAAASLRLSRVIMQFPSLSSIDSGSDSEDGDLQLFLPYAYQPGRLVSIQDFERLLEHEVTTGE